MKKNYVHALLLVGLLLNTSLFSAAPMEDRNITIQIAGETKRPPFVKKINSLESAKRLLQQKAHCLLSDSTECTGTDRLALNYAFGFAAGFALDVDLVSSALSSSGAVKNEKVRDLAQVLVELTLLKGALLRPMLTRLSILLGTAFFVIADIAGIVQQTQAASSRFFFLKAVGNYIAMNAKCAWAESYCERSLLKAEGGLALTPFARRAVLFFWMGYVSGLAAKKIWRSKPVRPLRKSAQKFSRNVREEARATTGAIYENTKAFAKTAPTRARLWWQENIQR